MITLNIFQFSIRRKAISTSYLEIRSSLYACQISSPMALIFSDYDAAGHHIDESTKTMNFLICITHFDLYHLLFPSGIEKETQMCKIQYLET